MTLPLLISEVSYFDNAYRGDLIITRGVLYYLPWVNVALEEKQKFNSGQLDRLFPLNLGIELAGAAIKALSRPNKTARLEALGIWQLGQTDDAFKARLDAFIADLKTKPAPITDYEYGLPRPMRFAVAEIKNLSLTWGLRFDTDYDTHDFNVGSFDQTELLQALKEAGFVSA